MVQYSYRQSKEEIPSMRHLKECSSFAEFKEEFLAEASEALDGMKAESSLFTDCEFMSAERFYDDHDVIAEISTSDGIKSVLFPKAIKLGAYKLSEEDQAKVDSLFAYLDEANSILEAERQAEIKAGAERAAKAAKLIEEAKAKKKAKEEEREAREKFEKKVESAKKKFVAQMAKAKLAAKSSAIQDEDEAIGWLAKHLTRISAEIPDFLEPQFSSRFGDAPKTVVSTATKSAGGYDEKWSLSASVHLDTDKGMPAYVAEMFKGKKDAHSVSLALKLIYDYGFKFGTEQDIEEIRDSALDKSKFDYGYSL